MPDSSPIHSATRPSDSKDVSRLLPCGSQLKSRSFVVTVTQASTALERPSLRRQVRARQPVEQPEDDVVLFGLVETQPLFLGKLVQLRGTDHPLISALMSNPQRRLYLPRRGSVGSKGEKPGAM